MKITLVKIIQIHWVTAFNWLHLPSFFIWTIFISPTSTVEQDIGTTASESTMCTKFEVEKFDFGFYLSSDKSYADTGRNVFL